MNDNFARKYLECFASDVRVHVRSTHTAGLVRFLANGTLEGSLVSEMLTKQLYID